MYLNVMSEEEDYKMVKDRPWVYEFKVKPVCKRIKHFFSGINIKL